MCARRFLAIVFVLTLLVVAGAFLFFQYGGSALRRVGTPQGHYAEPPPSSGPDYSKSDSWIARPGIPHNASQWRPAGYPPPRAIDFDTIDGALFAPAEVWVSSLESGKTWHAGRLNLQLLREQWMDEA